MVRVWHLFAGGVTAAITSSFTVSEASAPVASGQVNTFLFAEFESARSLCHNVLNFPGGDEYKYWYALNLAPNETESVDDIYASYDAIEDALKEKARLVSSLAVPGQCLSKYLELLCLTSFAEAQEMQEGSDVAYVPRPVSRSACDTMMEVCGRAQQQFNFIDFSCESTVPAAGLPAHKDYYFEQYAGLPAFPSEPILVTFNVSVPGSNQTVPNPLFVEPVVPSAFSAELGCGVDLSNGSNETTCSANEFFAETSDCRCVLAPACPFPAYAKSTYNTYIGIVLALLLLSIPLNLSISAYFKKFKNVPYIPWVAGSALVYVLINVVLTLLKGTDFSCVESEFGRDISWTTTVGQVEEDPLCYVSRVQVHLLQVILGAAGCAFFGVFDAVNSAYKGVNTTARLSSSRSKRIFKAILVFIYVIVVPAACAAMTLTFGNERGGRFQSFNVIRYAFSCGPEYEDVWMEIAFIHGPIIFAGLLILVMCCLITRVAWLLHRRAADFGQGSTGIATTDDTSLSDSATAKKKERKRKKRKEQKRVNTALTIAKRVAFFGFITAVFLLAYSASTIFILLELEDFSQELTQFLDCQIGFDFSQCSDSLGSCELTKNTEESCAALDPRDQLPASWLMGLNFCSAAAIPLLFGLMFGITHVRGLFVDLWNWLATCGTVEPLNRSYGTDSQFYAGGQTGSYGSSGFASSSASGSRKGSFMRGDSFDKNSYNDSPRMQPFKGGGIVAPGFSLDETPASPPPPGLSAPPPGLGPQYGYADSQYTL